MNKNNTLYLVRSRKGDLTLHIEKPKKEELDSSFINSYHKDENSMVLPKEWFPYVNYENSPFEVELSLKLQNSLNNIVPWSIPN